MLGDNREAVVMTVEGPLAINQLGITSIHEHLSTDLGCYVAPPRTERQKRFADHPVALELLGDIRRDLTVFADALIVKDQELVAEELREFRALGGSTVVEMTPKGLVPDPVAVREIGRAAGVQVVMGCGYYVGISHPDSVHSMSREDIAEELISEIADGFGDTGIRPGVIGEIGTSQPVEPDEWKVLDAACIAQRETGLPLFVHVAFGATGGTAPEVVEHVLDAGVIPDRLNVCHMDGRMDLEYQKRVAEYGVFISFDTFGLEIYYDSLGFNHNCHDSQREIHLLALIEAGYLDQLVVGQDVCTKIQLQHFGGYGYGHILRHIVPSFRHRGADEASIQQLLVDNPQRLLGVPNDDQRSTREALAVGGSKQDETQ